MRYVELRVRPEGRWFHPIDEHIAADPDLRHGPVHNINRLEDGTAVILYEIVGPKSRIGELLEAHGTSLKRETANVGESTLVWAHIDPDDIISELLDIMIRYSIIVDTPIDFTADDELSLTLIGESDVIRELFANTPEDAQVTVEKTGDYQPTTERLFGELTARQKEVLLAALEAGYYDESRQATYDDIASVVDCSATTVGEHLRKIEGRLVRGIVPVNA